ncbi:MAG: hypothetical protein ABW163_13435 [Luteimonas sp.]
MRTLAIVLGAVAWLIPISAQLWMWQQLSPGRQSHGLLWMIVTGWTLLPAGAVSLLGAWLWQRTGRIAVPRPALQRIGLVLIAAPAAIVALVGLCVVASFLFERAQAWPTA